MNLLKSTFEKKFVQHTMMIALPIMLQNGWGGSERIQ